MAFSFTQATGDGSTTAFTFSFTGPDNGYYSEDQIKVYVDDVEVTYTLTGTNQVTLDSAPAEGASVWIKREPDITNTYTNFSRGNNFGKDNINRAFQQMLYLIQRIQDGFKEEGYYQKQDMNLGNFKITNVGDGEDDTDAVNKAQLDYVEGLATSKTSIAESWATVAEGHANDASASSISAGNYADDAAASASLADDTVTAGVITLNNTITSGVTTLNDTTVAHQATLQTYVDTTYGYMTTSGDYAAAASASADEAAGYAASLDLPLITGNYGKFLRTKLDGTGLLYSGLPENYIINGNFSVWGRGTSQTKGGYNSADRWCFAQQGPSFTFSRATFTLGQSYVPGNTKYYAACNVTAGSLASDYLAMLQRIEGVHTLENTTVTLSLFLRGSVAGLKLGVEFAQVFGTGGSPSAEVTGIGTTLLNLTTDWTRYTITVAIPSISGKTLGTNGDDYLQLNFWVDAGSDYDVRSGGVGHQTGVIDIAMVQVEEGAEATFYKERPQALEHALCKRYFEIARGVVNKTNTYASTYWTYKRVTPYISYIQWDIAGNTSNFNIWPQGMFQAANMVNTSAFWAWIDAEL